MRGLLLVALSLAAALASPIPENVASDKSISLTDEQKEKLARFFIAVNPMTDPESETLKLLVEFPKEELDKYDTTIARHKDFTNFDDVLADLKKVDSPVYAKFEPLYKKLKENYLSLSPAAQALVKAYYLNVWQMMTKAAAEGSTTNMIKPNLQGYKDKLVALPQADQDAIKAKFPIFYGALIH